MHRMRKINRFENPMNIPMSAAIRTAATRNAETCDALCEFLQAEIRDMAKAIVKIKTAGGMNEFSKKS